jgi:hypothetical protein
MLSIQFVLELLELLGVHRICLCHSRVLSIQFFLELLMILVKITVEPQRIRISADVIVDALDEVVNDSDAPDELVRCTVAVVIDFVCCSRGDTGVGIQVGDVKTTAEGRVIIRLRRHKGEVRRDELTGRERVVIFEPDAVVGLCELIRRWEFIRSRSGVVAKVGLKDSYYALWEDGSSRNWAQSKMDGFLQVVLRQQGRRLPLSPPERYRLRTVRTSI